MQVCGAAVAPGGSVDVGNVAFLAVHTLFSKLSTKQL
jgi:hypothetical protein